MFLCEKLSKTFEGVAALVDVELRFPESGVVAVMGPNGAGKTTLFNIMSGWQRPDSGRCTFGARNLAKLAPYQVARLGVARTFQDLRFIKEVSVLENVLLARPKQRGESLFRAIFGIGIADAERQNQELATNILTLVGLQDKIGSRADEISYGEQKLLTLACCVASEASVLLLDEPVAGVHPGMVRPISSLLLSLKAQGKLVVLIEHDIEIIRDLADQVIVMDSGRVIAVGGPHDVLGRPEILKAYIE